MRSKDEIISLTKKLVAIPSVSTSKNNQGEYNENLLASFIAKTAQEYNLPTSIITAPDGRNCVSIFLKGTTKKTIALIAHHDTVGIEDMEGLAAFDIDANAKNFKDSDTYFYGRGAGDMKAGIAVGLAVLEQLQKMTLHTNILFISAPDEENESVGILSAISYLKKLKDENGYEYIGVLNLDSGLQDPNHPERKVADIAGAIGKLLPCFYVVGRSSHASDPFEGISSSEISSALISELNDNPLYCDYNTVTKKFSPPPVCLKATDIKSEYNTQLPLKSFLYFNYHMYEETPKEVLEKMMQAAQKAGSNALGNNAKKYVSFMQKQGKEPKDRVWDKKIQILTSEDLFVLAQKNSPSLQNELKEIVANNAAIDARELNLKLVEHMGKIADITAPYIVCFFSKPYYPSSYSQNDFTKTVSKTIEDFAQKENIIIDINTFSDGMSDINYMQINKEKVHEIKTYLKNNPLALETGDIDVDALVSISMPIASIGPSAFSPHQREEKVEIAYTFDQYPQLILTIIQNLQTL